MNKPEDMFDIIREVTNVPTDVPNQFYVKTSYYLIYKATGEKHFPKKRKYGYSSKTEAKIARTRLFNDYMKALENMLGKA